MSEDLDLSQISITLEPKHPQGGQYAGTRPMIMVVAHEASGITVRIDLEYQRRSQHKARSLALEMIECALTSPFNQA